MTLNQENNNSTINSTIYGNVNVINLIQNLRRLYTLFSVVTMIFGFMLCWRFLALYVVTRQLYWLLLSPVIFEFAGILIFFRKLVFAWLLPECQQL
jgi:hypothetical protein